MKLWIICRKTKEFGATDSGRHLKQPNDREIYDAIDECLNNGTRTLYIYHSKRNSSSVRDLIVEAWPDQIIGWSDCLTTADGFVLDTHKTWSAHT